MSLKYEPASEPLAAVGALTSCICLSNTGLAIRDIYSKTSGAHVLLKLDLASPVLRRQRQTPLEGGARPPWNGSRGTLLIENSLPPGLYGRPMPQALWWSSQTKLEWTWQGVVHCYLKLKEIHLLL